MHPTNVEVPSLQAIDHLHLHVADRRAAEQWYARVLGMQPVAALQCWAADGGPLTLSDRSGQLHLALFERPVAASRSTLALRVDAASFLQWQRHLRAQLPTPAELEDHQIAWSLYFSDPDGNPFEITCYEYPLLSALLEGEYATMPPPGSP